MRKGPLSAPKQRGLGGGHAALLGALMLSCNLVADLDRDYFQIVPNGWDGPVDLLVAEEDEPTGCRHGYVEIAEMFHSGLSDGGAAASCDCEPPLSACRQTLETHELDSLCEDEPFKTVAVAPGECVQFTTNSRPLSVREPVLERFSCVPTVGALPAPRWQLNARVCRGTAGACIMRSGEWPCPPGPFNERQLFYGDYLDTRVCNCGHVTGSCNGGLMVFPPMQGGPGSGEPCTGEGDGLVPGVCYAPMDVGLVTVTGDAEDLQCSQDGAAAIEGELLPASPVTVCCQL